MIRAATLVVLLSLAAALPFPAQAAAPADTGRSVPRKGVSAPPAGVSTPTSAVAGSPAPDQAGDHRDSAVARIYRIANRPFSQAELNHQLSVLKFKPAGKAESSAVIRVWRDGKGAMLAYETRKSEWSYAYDSVAFLGPDEWLPDSMIHRATDSAFKHFLGKKSGHYSFVNFEKTMLQRRVSPDKDSVEPPVPVHYFGRYLRKLGGRRVLGDDFQLRIGVGRGYAIRSISFRDPVLIDSSRKAKVPTPEMVQEYLDKWAKEPVRLGKRHYPYHPDRLRITKLEPKRVFASYVEVQEKRVGKPKETGAYLVPKVTVLAQATLARSRKKMKLPPPPDSVLLHFHFPCTPGVGLCWPDGKQGLQDAAHEAAPKAPARTAPKPSSTVPRLPAVPSPGAN